MPRNLELKAHYLSAQLAERTARRLGARYKGSLQQRDTYFHITFGRLKLRETNRSRFELIYYQRPNKKSGRYSDFTIVLLPSAQAMKQVCTALFGKDVVVHKTRRLYLFRNARIHIDMVRGLGAFLEFEVLVTKGKRQAQALLAELIDVFKIPRRSFVGVSYSDLLRKKRTTVRK
ncbi:MAG: class IV adenylate cyclase [Bacteroidota bacterium]